ncbi:MAG: hypothetical protein PHH77_09935, partial [Victivallaceae bacterium]|nr:hypothetical protein [Victivallaceae bacterium]
RSFSAAQIFKIIPTENFANQIQNFFRTFFRLLYNHHGRRESGKKSFLGFVLKYQLIILKSKVFLD